MERYICKHCHHMDAKDVAGILETDLNNGLSPFEAKHRMEVFGPNLVSEGKKKSALKRLLAQFHNPLIYILLVATLVTLLLKEYSDSIVIFAVVAINAFIGFIQESKAEKALESLKRMVLTEAFVTRGGSRMKISSVDIVPGDIVFLQSGMKVPADIRLFSHKDLQVDESALTGESVPVHKEDRILEKETVLADRKNMAYAGTLVTYGQSEGIVVATGEKTETGRIAYLIKEARELETPLTKKISRFSMLLLYVVCLLAIITFVAGIVRSNPVIDMFMASVALAVGMIPEGLPAALTITLAIGVARMARRKAVIRKLPAVETLGSTTVICSDKTGTLTENQMTVKSVASAESDYEVTGSGYSAQGEVLKGERSIGTLDTFKALKRTILCGVLCNDSRVIESSGVRKVEGDPTEGALIVCAEKAGITRDRLVPLFKRLDVMPFESDRQFMATLNLDPDYGSNAIFIKGSLEKLLSLSDEALLEDGSLGKIDKRDVELKAEKMAKGGLRVLAFAQKSVRNDHKVIHSEDLKAGFVLLGIQGMIDPPRKEAIEAVAACRTAGIKVKMITGDHAVTATSIAMQIGIIDHDDKGVITGSELSMIKDEDLVQRIDDIQVFARVTPDQKLRLVDALQERGHVVAMTGDGVNDAPALKQANIGVAMGISGTDVAKEASDMVLLDDNFASIEAAVEEGRGVFDNLTKFIVWTLPTNLGEGLVLLAGIMLGTVLPILPIQILWINMTTAVLLGLSLAFEPKEPGIMERPPRDPKEPILTRTLIWRMLLVGALMTLGAFGLFEYEEYKGSDHSVARTAVVNVIVMVETFYLLNCRSLKKSLFAVGMFSNIWTWAGIALMMLSQMVFTYSPFMNRIFDTRPLGFNNWLMIFSVSILIFMTVAFEKWVRNHRPGHGGRAGNTMV